METQIKETTYLAFELSGFSFAINLNETLKILDYELINPNPYKHNFFLGEININDYFLPVFDLKTRLSIPNTFQGKKVIVIKMNINDEHTEAGIVVDNLVEITSFSPDCIIPCNDFTFTPAASYAHTIAKMANGYFFILETSKVFNKNDIKLINTLNNERLVMKKMYA